MNDLKNKPLAIVKGGSDAIHKLGNIKRDNDNAFTIHKEDDNFFYGMFLEGFGFFDVKINKEDIRELTEKEIENISNSNYGIGDIGYGSPIKSEKDIWRKNQ